MRLQVGYYHWVLEMLPRLILAKDMYEDLPPILVATSSGDISSMHGFMNQSLELLGVKVSALLPYPILPPAEKRPDRQ